MESAWIFKKIYF